MQQAQAENALTAALRSVFAVAEAYPQLQASRNFSELQAELSDTENRIAYARQYYNDAVLTYNTAAQTVPTNIVAGCSDSPPASSSTRPRGAAAPCRSSSER